MPYRDVATAIACHKTFLNQLKELLRHARKLPVTRVDSSVKIKLGMTNPRPSPLIKYEEVTASANVNKEYESQQKRQVLSKSTISVFPKSVGDVYEVYTWECLQGRDKQIFQNCANY